MLKEYKIYTTLLPYRKTHLMTQGTLIILGHDQEILNQVLVKAPWVNWGTTEVSSTESMKFYNSKIFLKYNYKIGHEVKPTEIRNKVIFANYTLLWWTKYFLNWIPDIYCICIKRDSCMKPSNFLSTLKHEYQQRYLRNPFLNWIQGHFFLPNIQYWKIKILIYIMVPRVLLT